MGIPSSTLSQFLRLNTVVKLIATWLLWSSVYTYCTESKLGTGGSIIRSVVCDIEYNRRGETHDPPSLPVRVGPAYADGRPSASLPLRQGACIQPTKQTFELVV